MSGKIFVVVAMAMAVVAAEAAPDAKAKAANDRRLRDLRGELARFASGVNARPSYARANPGGKNWAKIAELEKEALALLALKDNAPDSVSASELYRTVGRAYGCPIHLRHTSEAEKAFAAAVGSAKTPDDQALANYWQADFKYREAKDDGKKWLEAKKAAFATPGMSPALKLELLSAGVPGLRYEEDGWTVVEKAPELQRKYFDWLLGWQGYPSNLELTWFDRRGDSAHLLAVCDKALTVCPEKDRSYYRSRRRTYLLQLGRGDEAECEILHDLADAKKPNERASCYSALACLMAGRAQRYGAPADPALVEKSFRYFEMALEEDPKNGGPAQEYIVRAMAFRRYDVAKRLLAQWAGTKPDRRYAGFLGDIAYYEGDYATAVKWYLSHDKMENYDPHPPNRQDRIVESLYAVGRYEDALKKAENLASWFTWSDYKADLIATLKAKVAAEKEAQK